MKVFNDITVTKSNVNSKALFNIVNEAVMSYIGDGTILFDKAEWRLSFESLLDEHMSIVADETKNIDRWKVVFNAQNNTDEQMSKNLYYLDVYYNQLNCLNTTHVRYRIHWYIISKSSTDLVYGYEW